jgi:hypothetical protein
MFNIYFVAACPSPAQGREEKKRTYVGPGFSPDTRVR